MNLAAVSLSALALLTGIVTDVGATPDQRGSENKSVRLRVGKNRSETVPISRYSEGNAFKTFPLLVENSSKRDVVLYTSGCSCGDEELAFEVITPDKKHAIVQGAYRPYFMNFTQTIRLHPQDIYVIDVAITDGSFGGFNSLLDAFPESLVKLKIRAILTQSTNNCKQDRDFWEGSTSSRWYDLVIRK